MWTDSSAEMRDRLKRLSEQYSDGLRLETRSRILTSTLRSIPARRTGSAWSFLPRMAAAAAVIAILALPAFRLTPGDNPPIDAASMKEFEVTAQGGEVILTWQNGDKPHRVVRATSREELARLQEIPGEIIRGQRWVDNRPDDSAVVYYFVE